MLQTGRSQARSQHSTSAWRGHVIGESAGFIKGAEVYKNLFLPKKERKETKGKELWFGGPGHREDRAAAGWQLVAGVLSRN